MNPIADGFKISDLMMPAVAFSQSEMADIFYNLRNDDSAPMLLESCTPEEADIRMNPGADQVLEAVTAVYNRLDRTMSALVRVLNRYANTVQVVGAPFLGPNRKNNLFAYKTVTFTFSDEQTVSILFHSPGRDPLKFVPEDTLIAYRWMLNRRDITATVSPERGSDINLQTMARRIMQLVEENSQKFQERNAERKQEEERFNQLQEESAQVDSKVEALTQENADLSTRIEDIDLLIARLKERLDNKELEQQSTDTGAAEPGDAEIGARGSKYDSSLSVDDIVKKIKGDIASAMPNIDASVRKNKDQVSIAITGIPGDMDLFNNIYLGDLVSHGGSVESLGSYSANKYTSEPLKIRSKLKDIADQYRGDASMSFVVTFDSELEARRRELELEGYRSVYLSTESEAISGNSSKGSKYDKSMTMNDIAKAIRKEIADALPAGFKVSVRQNNSTGSSAIRAEITAIPSDQQLFSSEYLAHVIENGESEPFRGERYSPAVLGALSDIKRIADQYNYDNSDSMTDYFDVNFYFNVSVDHSLAADRKKIELGQMQAQPEEAEIVEPGTGRHINPNEVGSGEMIYWHNENGTQQVMYRGTLDDKTATVMLNGIQMSAPIEELFKPDAEGEDGDQNKYPDNVVSVYLTQSGKEGAVIKARGNGYSYSGEWGAGSLNADDMLKQVRQWKLSKRGLSLSHGVDFEDHVSLNRTPGSADPTPAENTPPASLTDLDVALARDIAGSLGIIAGIDSGDEKGWNRSLFVSSIANKIKTRAKRGDTEIADAALRMVAEFNASAIKPAITQRNNVWSSTGKSYQDYAVAGNPAPQQSVAPEPQDQPPEVPAPEENTGETPVNENQNRADALNDALEQLLNETDAAKLEKNLDDLAEQAEAEGLMDELDAALNNAADHLTELLTQEATNVA